jgi:hypothetical protein
MTGLELAVGYLAAWAWLKARRLAGRVDAEVDEVLDAGIDRLHEIVLSKLAGDPALALLETEAVADLDAVSVRDRTRDRVRLALEEAAEADTGFAARLAELVAELRDAEQPLGGGVAAVGERAVAVGGNAVVHAEGGSAAALTMGDVVLDGVPSDPPRPGRSRD